MSRTFSCSKCVTLLTVPEGALDQPVQLRVRCPACGADLAVFDPDAPAPAAEHYRGLVPSEDSVDWESELLALGAGDSLEDLL